jgi:hypothetical protein
MPRNAVTEGRSAPTQPHGTASKTSQRGGRGPGNSPPEQQHSPPPEQGDTTVRDQKKQRMEGNAESLRRGPCPLPGVITARGGGKKDTRLAQHRLQRPAQTTGKAQRKEKSGRYAHRGARSGRTESANREGDSVAYHATEDIWRTTRDQKRNIETKRQEKEGRNTPKGRGASQRSIPPERGSTRGFPGAQRPTSQRDGKAGTGQRKSLRAFTRRHIL